ncbi:hypothetical protein F385_3588 [Pantoea agglomerans 299R]|nr:hypothetical protein F385_3588 [Pantoea agglomerans 299R]
MQFVTVVTHVKFREIPQAMKFCRMRNALSGIKGLQRLT